MRCVRMLVGGGCGVKGEGVVWNKCTLASRVLGLMWIWGLRKRWREIIFFLVNDKI